MLSPETLGLCSQSGKLSNKNAGVRSKELTHRFGLFTFRTSQRKGLAWEMSSKSELLAVRVCLSTLGHIRWSLLTEWFLVGTLGLS